jgi:hypothetical protein
MIIGVVRVPSPPPNQTTAVVRDGKTQKSSINQSFNQSYGFFSPCLSIHSFTRSTVSDPSRVADQLATMFRSTLSRTGAMLTPWLWTQIYRYFSMGIFVMEKAKKKPLHQFLPHDVHLAPFFHPRPETHCELGKHRQHLSALVAAEA